MRLGRRYEQPVGESTLNVGVVDIGTNSIRLLVTSGHEEIGRWVEVTGLGQGVQSTGQLDDDAMRRTVLVLQQFARRMDDAEVEVRQAIATSASRDASNRELFFDMAESALRVRPTLISGSREAQLAFEGATENLDNADGAFVSDIGGGSTEFVTSKVAKSIDIGTVRLTELVRIDQPASEMQIRAAIELVDEMFATLEMGSHELILGIAGTWTSLASIGQGISGGVHGQRMGSDELRSIRDRLAHKTMVEIETLPGLDPRRAPVILSGAVIAASVMAAVGADVAVISEKDTLDAVASELLALR